jgi:hypothetical protein
MGREREETHSSVDAVGWRS